jgi:hypothetical protein
MAASRPARPAAPAAATIASPAALPAISGTERRKPNCAPEAVDNVVAMPGVAVEISANRTSGMMVSDMRSSYSRSRHA